MRLTAKIFVTPTLRGTNIGQLEVPAWWDLRSSDNTSARNPVRLIAGSTGVYITVEGSVGLVTIKLYPLDGRMAHPVALSNQLLTVTTLAMFLNTSGLRGLYAVIAADGRGNSATWYVHWSHVQVVSVHFDGDPTGYDMGLDGTLTMACLGDAKLNAEVLVVPNDFADFTKVHVGFIQNLHDQPRFTARYDWISDTGETEKSGTLGEWTRHSGPWLDSQVDEWRDCATEARDGSAESFPFMGGEAAGSGSAKRELEMKDQPGFTVPLFMGRHRRPLRADVVARRGGWVLRQMGGSNRFTTAIAARTPDAPFTFIAFWITQWESTADLKFNHVKADEGQSDMEYYAKYTNAGMLQSGQVNTLLVQSKAPNIPRPANELGIEIYGPTAVPPDDVVADLMSSDLPWQDG